MFIMSLSGFQVWWRHGFSVAGLTLGLLAFGGVLFPPACLFTLSFQVGGRSRLALFN